MKGTENFIFPEFSGESYYLDTGVSDMIRLSLTTDSLSEKIDGVKLLVRKP